MEGDTDGEFYIGGLRLDSRPCNCNAPFAETFIDTDGSIKVSLWFTLTGKVGDQDLLFTERCVDMDDLNMVCTRCGWKLGISTK